LTTASTWLLLLVLVRLELLLLRASSTIVPTWE